MSGGELGFWEFYQKWITDKMCASWRSMVNEDLEEGKLGWCKTEHISGKGCKTIKVVVEAHQSVCDPGVTSQEIQLHRGEFQ